jgi:hypothetical protein
MLVVECTCTNLTSSAGHVCGGSSSQISGDERSGLETAEELHGYV